MGDTTARRGGHVVAAGVAEPVTAHSEELRLPADLDAALAEVIKVERERLRQERG